MFATVLQQEHTRLSKSNKTKRVTKKPVAADSSDSNMSVELTNKIHTMELAGNKKECLKNTETDEEQTYRETIESLGNITDSK